MIENNVQILMSLFSVLFFFPFHNHCISFMKVCLELNALVRLKASSVAGFRKDITIYIAACVL